jgi:hypothetical protein
MQQVPLNSRALSTGLPFPKTRRIVVLNNQPATLPGWAVLEVEEAATGGPRFGETGRAVLRKAECTFMWSGVRACLMRRQDFPWIDPPGHGER